VSVAGRIDLVRRLDTNEVTIVDLKSNDRAQVEAVTETQLHIYALGYQETRSRSGVRSMMTSSPMSSATCVQLQQRCGAMTFRRNPTSRPVAGAITAIFARPPSATETRGKNES
jgi:hypothetical protein